MQILIVEAEQKQQKELYNFFKTNYYDVISVSNGIKAQDIISNSNQQNKNIDIILVDVDKSNDISNIEFLYYLINNNIKTPFIFITRADNLYNIIDKLNSNSNLSASISWSYLIKPILDYSILLIIIEHLCAREHLLAAHSLYCDHIEQDKAKLKTNYAELEDDHKSGKNLHDQLLPKNNQNILSLNFSYFLHPSLYVSGDFIDYMQLDDRYALFYLSDVSGHGVSSAFVTVLVKASITQYAQEFKHMDNKTIINPKEMLSVLNKQVCAEKLGKYLTMAYFIYDKQENKLIYSIAGHYPFPILSESNKKSIYIGDRGYPVGMFENATFANYELKLSSHFSLAIFSDGIMEISTNENLDAKEQELLNIVDDSFKNINNKEDNNFNLDLLQDNLNIDYKNLHNINLPDDIAGLVVRMI